MTDPREFDWLLARLPSARALRILDVGCGVCAEGEALLETGAQLFGIDLDDAAIAAARERLPGARFECADGARFSTERTERTEREAFDVVLLRRPDLAAAPDRWRRVLERSRGWLAPSGLVVVTTPGPREAERAKAWLDELGFSEARLEETRKPEEAFVVTAKRAMRAAHAAAASEIEAPADVIVWSDAEGEAAEVCDVETGLCGPARRGSPQGE